MGKPATPDAPADPMGLPPLRLSMDTLGEFSQQPVGARFTLAEENHTTVYRKVNYSPGVKINGRSMVDLMCDLSRACAVCSQCPASYDSEHIGNGLCTERYANTIPCLIPDKGSGLIATEHTAFVAALEGFVSW